MKARRSNRKVSPHGGIVPILELIKKCGIPKAINDAFGARPHWSTYGFDDVFISLILTIMCGGSRLDHISKMRKKLAILPGFKVPSHDTVGRVLKSAATETKIVEYIRESAKGKLSTSSFNNNVKLNELLVSSTKKLGLFQTGRKYTIDIDATFVPTRAKEAEKSGHKTKLGFAPLVCLIDNIPVYVNLRSGNAAPNFNITDTLRDCIDLLEKNGIQVGRVRSDAAGHGKDMLEMLDSKGIKFVVRKPLNVRHKNVSSSIRNAEWTPVSIKTTETTWQCEIAEIPYLIKDSDLKSRIVVTRVPDSRTRKLMETAEHSYKLDKGYDFVKEIKLPDFKEPKSHYSNNSWTNFEGYNYKVIITNDFVSHPVNIILEYNKRGGSERNFAYLKQDCGWKIPPFMKLNQNAVYLIVAALANNVFRASVKAFKKYAPGVTDRCTLKTFQFVFIDVACAYIRGEFVFYNTDIEFEKIC